MLDCLTRGLRGTCCLLTLRLCGTCSACLIPSVGFAVRSLVWDLLCLSAPQAAAATEAKSQFLARMSHEIRTPLNGMIAVGQLLAETNLSPAQWDLVNTIRCSGETLLTLITDILDFR